MTHILRAQVADKQKGVERGSRIAEHESMNVCVECRCVCLAGTSAKLAA